MQRHISPGYGRGSNSGNGSYDTIQTQFNVVNCIFILYAHAHLVCIDVVADLRLQLRLGTNECERFSHGAGSEFGPSHLD